MKPILLVDDSEIKRFLFKEEFRKWIYFSLQLVEINALKGLIKSSETSN